MVDVISPGSDPAELAAAVEVAAASLTVVWAHAAESLQSLVSGPQLRALTAINRHGSLNLTGLAAELGAAPSATSRLCDRLVAASLVRRQLSAATRREITLTLRPAGQRLLAQLEQARRAEIAGVLQRMPPAAVRALVRGLNEFARAAEQEPAEQNSAADRGQRAKRA